MRLPTSASRTTRQLSTASRSPTSGLRINPDRLWETIHESCKWGSAHPYGKYVQPTHQPLTQSNSTQKPPRNRNGPSLPNRRRRARPTMVHDRSPKAWLLTIHRPDGKHVRATIWESEIISPDDCHGKSS